MGKIEVYLPSQPQSSAAAAAVADTAPNGTPTTVRVGQGAQPGCRCLRAPAGVEAANLVLCMHACQAVKAVLKDDLTGHLGTAGCYTGQCV
jgi:hypothetical protein